LGGENPINALVDDQGPGAFALVAFLSFLGGEYSPSSLD